MGKLVRDRIPEIMIKNKAIPKTHIASEYEYKHELLEKLKEEVGEFMKANGEKHSKEEMSDIFEVLHAICDSREWDRKEIESLRKNKAKKRGGFKKRIILE